jgi:hypothetical protein
MRGPTARDRENGEKSERDRHAGRLPAAQEVGSENEGGQRRSEEQDEAHFSEGPSRRQASGGAFREPSSM